MGATVFKTFSVGYDIASAFRSEVEHAQYMYGHGGYTGTIAEKVDFIEIKVPNGRDTYDYVDQLLAVGKYFNDNPDPRIEDKWGPAGGIKLRDLEDGRAEFLFFGIASE